MQQIIADSSRGDALQTPLVNEDYLSGLIELSREQNDEGLVDQLYRNLQHEYHAFLRDCSPWISMPEQRGEFQTRIHRLKNNFFNLGCMQAGSGLEDMYQLLKNPNFDPATLQNLWQTFQQTSEVTFSHLQDTIQKH